MNTKQREAQESISADRPIETKGKTPPAIEHDWAARITGNPDGTVTYEAFPETLSDGTENPAAKAMRRMRILLGGQYGK